jgi:hypothetical protein
MRVKCVYSANVWDKKLIQHCNDVMDSCETISQMYLLVGRKYLSQFKETKYENSSWIKLT